MDHLAKHAKDLLSISPPVITKSELPSVELALEKLKKFCEEHNIEIVKKETKQAELLQPAKWYTAS